MQSGGHYVGKVYNCGAVECENCQSLSIFYIQLLRSYVNLRTLTLRLHRRLFIFNRSAIRKIRGKIHVAMASETGVSRYENTPSVYQH